MSRRRFSREFKISTVKLVNEKGHPIAQVAKDLGVDASSIRYWIKQLSTQAGLEPTGEGELAAEIRRLREENKRLLEERDILKKAAAFFAKEQR